MKSGFFRGAAMVGAILLTGCMAAAVQSTLAKASQASKEGRCEDAREYATRAFPTDPGMRATAVGAIYADCDRAMPEAVRYWQLGARYGDSSAREYLARVGAPIPQPDLAEAPPPPLPRPGQSTCTVNRDVFGRVAGTTCQ